MTFDNLGLSPQSMENIRRAGYASPTRIQSAAIPIALKGRDLIGCAQTGTGKTAAFALPILEKIARERDAEPKGPLSKRTHSSCLILAPTRELCAQIVDHFVRLAGP